MTTDELRIILKINGAATYTHTINEITNVTNNYNKSVGNLMSTLTKLVSAGAIVKFGKQCIQAASDLQEVANVVDVTFGNTADTVNKWAKTQAASFGLSETAAKRYAGTYGTMAKQFGATTKQAASMAIELTKLTGDVSSFYNIDSKTAATKLKAVFTGETEGLKELGVVMTETQLSSYAMSKGMNKAFKDMTEQEKVVLRYQYTLEKLAHAQGDFARTSDGYANSTRSLSLQLENLKVEIGKELLPVAAMGIQAISKAIKALSPILINIAQNIKYYAEAWKNASAQTKAFAKVAVSVIAVLWLIPKVVALGQAAIRLLTMELVGLNGVLTATAGILGILFAAFMFKKLSDQVKEMKKAANDIDNLGESASISTDAVDDLSNSLDGLGDSAKGLDRFLASFDEVNKLGDGGSLMSSLVTASDLDNIYGAIDGIEELQSELDGISLPDVTPSGIFDGEFWKELGANIMGFINEVFFEPGEFWEDWKRGFDMIVEGIESVGEWLEKVAPQWSAFWENQGSKLYDSTHNKEGKATSLGAMALDKLLDDGATNNGETFTDEKGREVYKYRNDGTLSTAYEKQIRSGTQEKTVNNNTTNNNNQPVVYSPNILIDGRKITSAVIDNINEMTRSSGNSPLVELGG